MLQRMLSKRTVHCTKLSASLLILGVVLTPIMDSTPAMAAETTPQGYAVASPTRVSALSSALSGGWQGRFTYDVPAGVPGVFFHYPCPTGTVAANGGFATNLAAAPGLILQHNSPRLDLDAPGRYAEWSWTFAWPSSGAPTGSQLYLDAFCVGSGTPAPAFPFWASIMTILVLITTGSLMLRRRRVLAS